MRTRIAVAGVGVLLVALSPAAAQTVPTTPATIDVTCHGYDGGANPCVQLHPGRASATPSGDVRSGGRFGVQRRKGGRVPGRPDRLPDPV